MSSAKSFPSASKNLETTAMGGGVDADSTVVAFGFAPKAI
jgi:hypothetical protein